MMKLAEQVKGQSPREKRTPLASARGFGGASPMRAFDAGHSLGRMSVFPESGAGLMLQRYAVPGGLACEDVAPWLSSNSPYAPEWAETRCTYTFGGQARLSGREVEGGGVEMTATGHPGLSVSLSCPIDRPQWAPTPRPNRAAEVAAWNGMRSVLDAHEAQHRSIGQTWRDILKQRWQGLSLAATGTDKADARQQIVSQLASVQQGGQADAQAAQDAIDPFRGAVLNCP